MFVSPMTNVTLWLKIMPLYNSYTNFCASLTISKHYSQYLDIKKTEQNAL